MIIKKSNVTSTIILILITSYTCINKFLIQIIEILLNCYTFKNDQLGELKSLNNINEVRR